MNNLSNEEIVHNDKGLQRLCKTCIETANNFTTIKPKFTRGNQMSFMIKQLSKGIMMRSMLRNNFFKDRTGENKIRYTKQRSKCVSFKKC